MLDQLDLYDDMAQVGLVGRRSVTFKDGKQVGGRGWTKVVEGLTDTFFDFSLNIRLKYSEGILRRRNTELGGTVHALVRLVDMLLDENAEDEWKVTVTCADFAGETHRVRAKYVVGCDGGSSEVRRLAGIPFEGEDKEDHWVALDHGATRIGYALSPALFAKYGRKMSQEDAVKEAKAAMTPFEVEFETVDWHTVYGVKQHVAARLQDRERILLAGDAAHTHSSGSAQGMNTGTHDAVSLGWRLAGVLNGWYKPGVLASYSTERKVAADTLIANDRVISALISGHKPASSEIEERTPTHC
ncbi:hypothetical protein LTR56_024363 [Elasticomyces elasticus]|nr:hypothetical protein LTR56_024363 [Elasticomyces elasticus]KAK3623280.1 hypothetical protein LTR22_024452 [Elasticomyces elasticus]KAK4905912.1 hypothetical protein LTR49_024858 [Elasticomyces elasticus]KAK5743355.1 hypothetical protein LTS12_023906 [Elasticomyces elasticus]